MTLPPPWRAPLALLSLLWIAIAALFARDIAHMVSIWWTSSTYNHILLIPPLIAWLVAERARLIAPLTPAPWPAGMLALLAASGVWFVGQMTDIALLRHLGVILMVQGAVIVALGPLLVRALAFPLAYAVLLVPFGDEVVPLFQHITAQLMMRASCSSSPWPPSPSLPRIYVFAAGSGASSSSHQPSSRPLSPTPCAPLAPSSLPKITAMNMPPALTILFMAGLFSLSP
jgi:Transmembrane exosortase (Exosortase_EpsH)